MGVNEVETIELEPSEKIVSAKVDVTSYLPANITFLLFNDND